MPSADEGGMRLRNALLLPCLDGFLLENWDAELVGRTRISGLPGLNIVLPGAGVKSYLFNTYYCYDN